MTEIKRVSQRVLDHVDTLRKAGLDTQAFFDALVNIRDDSALPQAHREALYKLIATESFLWYLEALRGAPIDRVRLAEEAAKIGEENAAAIKKTNPGEAAAELLRRVLEPKPKK